jgi:hypothetical protein
MLFGDEVDLAGRSVCCDARDRAQRLPLAVFLPRDFALSKLKTAQVCERPLPELANFAKVIGDAFNR